jgi:hypothetical protein
MMKSKDGTLGTENFVIVEPKKNAKKPGDRKCDHMRDAIVVHGHDSGTQHIVCADPTCIVHHAKAERGAARAEADYRERQREEQRTLRLRLATRRAIGDAILKRFKTPTTEDWRLMTLTAVHNIQHEYRIDVCKRHGCYPKEKQPSSMDMLRNLGEHISKLDATACQRLLFDIALLGDIKSHYRTDADANLKKVAQRFKVDVAAIAKEVRDAEKSNRRTVRKAKKEAA